MPQEPPGRHSICTPRSNQPSSHPLYLQCLQASWVSHTHSCAFSPRYADSRYQTNQQWTVVILEAWVGITFVSLVLTIDLRDPKVASSQKTQYKISMRMRLTVCSWEHCFEESTPNGRLIVEVKTIADWLSLNSWYEYHQEMTECRTGNTGIWFLQSDEFQLWQREGNARLWVTGMRECSSIFSHLHC